MRESLALIRASWLTQSSYRMGMIVSLFGLVFVLLPLYFIANALQPTMQHTIAAEARQYFGFVVLGAVCFSLASTCTTALPSALEGAIGKGTLEAILGTPARLVAVCVGLMGYGVMWALVRAAILIAVAMALGADVVWRAAPAGAAVVILTMLSYVGLGLIFSAFILLFRTTGPIPTLVLTASMFLGGVYYPASVIPSWIRNLAEFLPLTYGLRAIRRLVLRGEALSTVAPDIFMLIMMTTASVAAGVGLFYFALRRARRNGALSSY
jgi:ABC-type polysaccharide/polyol phosphate export permease